MYWLGYFLGVVDGVLIGALIVAFLGEKTQQKVRETALWAKERIANALRSGR